MKTYSYSNAFKRMAATSQKRIFKTKKPYEISKEETGKESIKHIDYACSCYLSWYFPQNARKVHLPKPPLNHVASLS